MYTYLRCNPPLSPSPPVLRRPSPPSSAPTRWQCARFLSRSAIKFIPVARRQVMRVLQKGQASKCRLRNKNRAMNKILLARLEKKSVFEHMCGCWGALSRDRNLRMRYLRLNRLNIRKNQVKCNHFDLQHKMLKFPPLKHTLECTSARILLHRSRRHRSSSPRSRKVLLQRKVTTGDKYPGG